MDFYNIAQKIGGAGLAGGGAAGVLAFGATTTLLAASTAQLFVHCLSMPENSEDRELKRMSQYSVCHLAALTGVAGMLTYLAYRVMQTGLSIL
jgi:hypothetical protein